MAEYFPIPIYPEVYNLYLITGITLAAVIGLIGFLIRFHGRISQGFSLLVKRINWLSKNQQRISEDVKTLEQDVARLKVLPPVTPTDNLFRFILLRYLTTEREMSPEDKIVLVSTLLNTKPSPEILDLLSRKKLKGKKEISEEEVEKIISEVEDGIKELIKKKIRERLG